MDSASEHRHLLGLTQHSKDHWLGQLGTVQTQPKFLSERAASSTLRQVTLGCLCLPKAAFPQTLSHVAPEMGTCPTMGCLLPDGCLYCTQGHALQSSVGKWERLGVFSTSRKIKWCLCFQMVNKFPRNLSIRAFTCFRRKKIKESITISGYCLY